jgi:hypothetical protein
MFSQAVIISSCHEWHTERTSTPDIVRKWTRCQQKFMLLFKKDEMKIVSDTSEESSENTPPPRAVKFWRACSPRPFDIAQDIAPLGERATGRRAESRRQRYRRT